MIEIETNAIYQLSRSALMDGIFAYQYLMGKLYQFWLKGFRFKLFLYKTHRVWFSI